MPDFKPANTPLLEPELDHRSELEYEGDYNLLLHDDDDHTYEYVIEMLTRILQISIEKAFQHALEVDTQKVTLLLKGPLEIVEHRQEQIHTYGPDWRLKRSKGPMRATVEKARQ